MVGLSLSVSYAVSALACLGRDKCSPGLVREIAKCSGVPAPYLAKIFTRLADAGIIETKRGRNGGNWLARSPESVLLIEIVEAIEGPHALRQCLLGNAICSDSRGCPMHDFWQTMRQRIARELSSATLADVIAFEARQKAAVERRTTGSAAMDSTTVCGEPRHGNV